MAILCVCFVVALSVVDGLSSQSLGAIVREAGTTARVGQVALHPGYPDGPPARRPEALAVRIPDELAVRIDGSLGEEAWALAEPITVFRQREPVQGGIPSEKSEVRVLYDDEAIYIGALLHDSEPDRILANQLERNGDLGADDRFMWILATFGDGRTGYYFETNPAGMMGDGLVSDGSIDKRWDGVWEVRAQVVRAGWSVEVRIPFSTLNFDPYLDGWGINFQRTIRRRNEEILWSGWRRNESLLRPTHAGVLRGLEGISQGWGLEIKPYAVSSATEEPVNGNSWDGTARAGVDLGYSLTPSLRAAVTINTDFAEVDVDQRRVNLTRFPLRFPEQRDFFLEGSSVFAFNWVDPFFSRRIGLVEGQEVPIRYGTRLGGQAGRFELGFYQVRTGRATLETADAVAEPWPAESFTVGRVKRSIFEQSHVGAIYTRRSSDPGPDGAEVPVRHTLGGDFDFYTSRALGRFNAQIEGFLIFHTDPITGGDLLSGDRRARGFRVDFPNDLLRFHTSFRDFGERWDPAVGFANRRGYRRIQPSLSVRPRPAWSAVRQLEFRIWHLYLTDLEGRLLTRGWDLRLLRIALESGDRFGIDAGAWFERLTHPFPIYGSGDHAIWIQPGDYQTWTVAAGFETAAHRRLSGGMVVERWFDFWTGDRTKVEVAGALRPRSGIALTAEYERNRVRLPHGAFDTNLLRIGWTWGFSPLTSITGSLQYDDITNVAGLFVRGRWLARPGSEVILVWTHNWRNERDELLRPELSTLSRGGALKVNYSYRI